MDDDKLLKKEQMFKEMDMIQEIINRMASNSFLVKGWTITLIVATLLFSGKEYRIVVGFLAVLSFWLLDAYFLNLERKYRHLYSWVINNRFNTNEHLFDLNPNRVNSEKLYKSIFSITLFIFYGLIIAILIISLIMNLWGIFKW